MGNRAGKRQREPGEGQGNGGKRTPWGSMMPHPEADRLAHLQRGLPASELRKDLPAR